MALYHLDQYSRTRVPHYTGYKPQAARNITLEQPSRGPSTETTSGHGAFTATRGGVPPQSHQHHNNSKEGIMGFFTSTGETVSDNGLSNAQLFYTMTRPGEGRVKGSQLPHSTVYGAPFKAGNSLV